MFFSPRFLGLDLSESAIKLAVLEMATHGQARLVGWQIKKLLPGLMVAGRIRNAVGLQQEITTAIKDIKGRRVRLPYIIASLPEVTTFLRAITLLPSEVLNTENITQELERHIPLSADEATFDAQTFVLPDRQGILLAAAPKQIVEDLVQVFENSGLLPSALETEAQAILRTIKITDPKISTIGILDLGASRAQLLVAQNGIPLLSSTLPFAGDPVINHLAQLMQWSKERVLTHLNNCERNSAECPIEWRKIFEEFAEGVSQGIKRHLETALESGACQLPQAFFLTGGMANLPNLPQNLVKKLGIPVTISDPLEFLILDTNIPTPAERLQLTVAIGLALRGIISPKV